MVCTYYNDIYILHSFVATVISIYYDTIHFGTAAANEVKLYGLPSITMTNKMALLHGTQLLPS